MEQKENKKKFDHINVPLAILKIIFQKFGSDKDGVGWRRVLLAYSWIWTWQILCKVGFGKMRKKDIYDQIEHDLEEPKPHIVVAALIKAGLVVWGRSEYNGKKNICLQCTYLNEKMEIPSQTECEVTVVESSVKGSAEMGEYYQCRKRYYRGANGDSYSVPLNAPKRPTLTAVWDGTAKQWREPLSAMPKQSNPSPTKAEVWEEPKMSVGVVWFPGGHYGYQDENGNIQKDWEGNVLYIPKKDAFNRPSIKHVYDFEVCRWCLPEEVTIPKLEF